MLRVSDTNHPSPVDKEEVIALAKQVAGHGTCMCGKLNLTELEAIFVVNSSDYTATKYYSCPLNGKEYFHATSHGPGRGKVKPNSYGSNRFKFNRKRLLRELQAQQEYAQINATKEEDMAVETQSLTKAIVKYMEGLYREKDVYKVSSKMVVEAFSHQAKTTVMAQLSGMKKAKIITTLDEKVPDQKGAVYFALTSILDQITAPKKEEVSEEVSKVTSVPEQPNRPKVTPIVANPFEKVQAQLEAINTRLSGLAQGYADLARATEFKSLFNSEEFRAFSRALEEAIENQNKALLKNLDTTITENHNLLSQKISQQPKTVKVDVQAIVDEFFDLDNEEAFVYRVRDELIDSLLKQLEKNDNHTPESIMAEFQNLHRHLNEMEASDYQRGVRDGIKIAAEMGLKLGGN